MAARTSWNPRYERAPDYFEDDPYADSIGYDDLLDQGFDEYGRLTRRPRRQRAHYDAMPEPQDHAEMRRAVDGLARRVEALAHQSAQHSAQRSVAGRGPGPEAGPAHERDAQSPRANATMQALDRLESRLDALQGEAQRRAAESANQVGLERKLAEQSAAEREKVEALMQSHFAVLDERIAALNDLARGEKVDSIRDDLAALGSRIEGLAADGQSVFGTVDQVRQQLAELRERLDSDGWSGANAVSAMQDRLELITEKLAQLELTPSALSAVELGYSNILERVSRIEHLAGQSVDTEDLTSRLDALRDQIARLENRDGLGSLEYRIAALSDNIDALAAQRGSDPAFDRVELKLADMARTIGTIRDRRDVHSGAIETRLADIAARIDKMMQDRGRIDFAPVERQIASLSSRIDRMGDDRQEIDLTGMERQLGELGSRIETMLNRPEPEQDEGPDFSHIETHLAKMHARLEELFAIADANKADDPPAVLDNIDQRLAGLNGRLDELALTNGNEPADLSPISSRLDTIEGRLGDLAKDQSSASLPVELSILSSKLNLIDEQLRELAPTDPDLPALFERLAEIDGRISQISEAQVDFSPVADQIAALEQRLTASDPAAGFDLQPLAGQLERIESRLDTMSAGDQADADGVADQLGAMNRRLDELPQAAEIDMAPLNEQLAAIEQQLRGLSSADDDSVDLSPVTHRLDRFEEYLAAFKPGELVDLSDIRTMLGGLDERVANLAAMPLAAPGGSEPVAPDFSVITDRLLRIDQRISALDVQPEPVDMSPVTERLAEIDRRISELNTQPEPVDFSPVTDRLHAIDEQISGMTAQSAPVDLSPVTDRLHAIDERISGMSAQSGPVDFSPVTDRLHAIDERISMLNVQPDMVDMSPVADRLQGLDERISALDVRHEPVDMSPVTERLLAIEQRLEAYQASESPVNDNLMPLLETLEGALRKIASTDEISALAEKVGGLHAALDNAGEGTAIDEMAELRNDITYLRRELRSMPMMAESDDGSGGLGSMLADIRDRLDRIPVEQPVTFRDLEDQIGRIVRSMEGGEGTGSLSQIETSLASIEARLEDAGPVAVHAALTDLPEGSGSEGTAAIAALAASIEGSISDLKYATATADEDTRRTLDALNATMELLVDRMNHLEGVAGSPRVAEAVEAHSTEQAMPEAALGEDVHEAHEEVVPEITIAPAEPAYEPAEPAYESAEPAYESAVSEDVADAVETAEKIAAEAIAAEAIAAEAAEAAEAMETAEAMEAEEAVDATFDPASDFGFQEPEEPQYAAEHEAEPSAEEFQEPHGLDETDPGIDPAVPEGETAEIGAEDSAEYGAEYGAGADYGHEPVPEADSTAVGEDPAAVHFEAQMEEPASAEPQAEQPAAFDMTDPAIGGVQDESLAPVDGDDQGENKSGVGAMLGRLTSSQILKRATGGRADSFTPAPDENLAQQFESQEEPGEVDAVSPDLQETAAPVTEEFDADSEEEPRRTRQGAGLGDLAAAAGLGFDTQQPEEQENQFLSAARRAARAAVLEAASVEPSVDAGKAEAKRPRRKLGLFLVLLIAVVAAMAFAGYKYWRGELDFNSIRMPSLGSISFFGTEALDDRDWQLASAADMAGSDSTEAQPEIHLNTLITNDDELEQISPSAEITFRPPETLTASPMQLSNTLASVVSAVKERLSIQLPEPTSGDYPIEGSDTIVTTASLADPAGENAMMPKQAEPPVAAQDQVALADPSSNVDSLSEPSGAKASPASLADSLPASIGSVGLRQAALANIPEAQFEIASRFADGSSVDRDLAAAAHWYEKAAASGLAPAQYRLGSLYEKGRGVAVDQAKAYNLYLQAAKAGNAKAMHNLAALYANGGDSDPDLVKAAEWFQKAADHGVRDSQFNMGVLYSRGLGVGQDLTEAYKWFAIAADSGDKQAGERRDSIANSLGQDALAEALSAASIFQPLPLKPEANLIIEPKGGWAAAASGSGVGGQELVRQVQSLLSRHGFDPGPADGLMGKRTSSAIEAFQFENGLPVTGRADLALLTVLQSSVN